MLNLRRLQIFEDLYKYPEKIFRDLQFAHINKKTAMIYEKYLKDCIDLWLFEIFRLFQGLESFAKFQPEKFQSQNQEACLIFCLENSIFIFDLKQKYLHKMRKLILQAKKIVYSPLDFRSPFNLNISQLPPLPKSFCPSLKQEDDTMLIASDRISIQVQNNTSHN